MLEEKAKEAIEAAYKAAIQNLYVQLSTAIMMAKGNEQDEQKAKAAFSLGLKFNMKIYNFAVEIIGAKK